MKEKIEKIINEAVEEVLDENVQCRVELAWEFLKLVKSKVVVEGYPDDVEVIHRLIEANAGAMPKMVVIKKLPSPVQDAFGLYTDEDRITVARMGIDGRWYATKDPSINFNTEEEAISYFKNQKIKFFLISDEEQEEVIRQLSQYIYIDYADVLGPRIASLVAMGAKDDSPNPMWNEKVRSLPDEA
jgi:hypothetical protein